MFMRILQQLSEIYFIDFSVRFRLPNTQAFHQPAVLLRCDTECFVLVARPLEPAFFKAFVEKQEAVAFPVECLDSVCSSAAKQEHRKTGTMYPCMDQAETAVPQWSPNHQCRGAGPCSRRRDTPFSLRKSRSA